MDIFADIFSKRIFKSPQISILNNFYNFRVLSSEKNYIIAFYFPPLKRAVNAKDFAAPLQEIYITPTGNHVAPERPANSMISVEDGESRVPSFPSGARRRATTTKTKGWTGGGGWHWPNFARTPSHAGLSQQLSGPLHTRTHCTHDWRWSSRPVVEGVRRDLDRLEAPPGAHHRAQCEPAGETGIWEGDSCRLGGVDPRWRNLDRTCAYVYARGDECDTVTAKTSAGKSAPPTRRWVEKGLSVSKGLNRLRSRDMTRNRSSQCMLFFTSGEFLF